MAREDIAEGLKQAVAKGEPAEKAIASFYNAGYPQDDIEDAARVLKMQTPIQLQLQQQQQKIPTAVRTQQSSEVVQKVSEYGKKPSKTGTIITVMLFLLLLVLLGILAAVVFFKDELSTFFSSLFLRSLF
ncbi:MAG: hypothetical protein AABX79_02250 [Nanoarchaeota archaeon]